MFDEDDLRERTDELAAFLRTSGATHGVAEGSWWVVGFSNGANIGSSLLLRHPQLLSGAVLFAAMTPYADPPQADLGHHRVVVANGERDPLATPAVTRRLVAQLSDRGAEVVEVPHPGGHGIDPRSVPRIAELVSSASPTDGTPPKRRGRPRSPR